MTVAYHFTLDTLRDGSPVPAIGETLRHEGPLMFGTDGLRASECPWDALRYAPGPRLHRVELGGRIKQGGDRIVASQRTILASMDATSLLRAFARQCALDVIVLWDAPHVVRLYLENGNEAHRDAAGQAAYIRGWVAGTAPESAANAAARAAARATVKGAVVAAVAAAWNAAMAASGGTIEVVAWDKEREAIRAAHRERFRAMVEEAMAEGRENNREERFDDG